MIGTTIRSQVVKYVIVGAASNFLLYFAYVIITTLGMKHIPAMTISYVTGVVVTFLFNKRWTFRHEGKMTATLGRYLVIYALGYLINFAILFILVDSYGLQHHYVQGIAIILVSIFLFVLQRKWAFSSSLSQRQ